MWLNFLYTMGPHGHRERFLGKVYDVYVKFSQSGDGSKALKVVKTLLHQCRGREQFKTFMSSLNVIDGTSEEYPDNAHHGFPQWEYYKNLNNFSWVSTRRAIYAVTVTPYVGQYSPPLTSAQRLALTNLTRISDTMDDEMSEKETSAEGSLYKRRTPDARIATFWKFLFNTTFPQPALPGTTQTPPASEPALCTR